MPPAQRAAAELTQLTAGSPAMVGTGPTVNRVRVAVAAGAAIVSEGKAVVAADPVEAAVASARPAEKAAAGASVFSRWTRASSSMLRRELILATLDQAAAV